MYEKIPPLYPFGFGLSYTRFVYSDIRKTETGVAVTVTNAGGMAAEEAAQLYIDSAGLPGQPRWRLKGFRRIRLQPGEAGEVAFPLTDESFSLFGADGKRRLFAGTYTLYVGGGQPCADAQKLQITVGGSPAGAEE